MDELKCSDLMGQSITKQWIGSALWQPGSAETEQVCNREQYPALLVY